MLPSLHIHLLAHSRSASAQQLAEALMARFVEPVASGGLRIPVFFTPDRGDDLPPRSSGPDRLDLDAAAHSLVVVLADSRMLRSVDGGTGQAWKDFVLEIQKQTPLDASPHHLLPVALDQAGFGINDQCHVLPALTDSSLPADHGAERRLAELSFHIAARALQLLEHGKVPATAPNRMAAPVRIFISHAKADLNPTHDDPVRHTMAACDEEAFPIEKWFDARNIATSQDFAEAIQAGIRDCSIMLAFLTDQYSGRPWCRREVLEAKRLGAHMLVVNALESGEARSFPYGGNVPVVRWNPAGDPKVAARRVIERAVLEALRFKHNRAALMSQQAPTDVVLPTAPEALTLADISGMNVTCLYPDPPLGREELEILHKLRPNITFTTPLSRIAAQARPQVVQTFCVSISESGDARRYGLSDAHVATLSDEIQLYLLLAGLKIAYGGALSGNFEQGSNFTLRLFELVKSYAGLAAGVRAPFTPKSIINVAPWPLWLNYGDAEMALFDGDIADFRKILRPDLPWRDDELFSLENGRWNLNSDSPEKRYAWARGLSAMRAEMTAASQARLVLGGKLTGFAGLVPGVVEEAWLSMCARQPLYLVGGYGGAARALCDVLLSENRAEFSLDWPARHIPDYVAAVGHHPLDAPALNLMPDIGSDISDMANRGLGAILNNGLDDGENRQLMASTDAQQIAELVLRGLGRLNAPGTE